MSFFSELPLLPNDPILGIPAIFVADPKPLKVNLSVGTYRSTEGTPVILNCVQSAEAQLIQKHLNKDYLPIEGNPEMLQPMTPLVFGQDLTGRMVAVQALGGTGALRIAAELLSRQISKTIFIPQPSWHNHRTIFEQAGLSVCSYPYFQTEKFALDFEGMSEAIRNMPQRSIILLHASCHNPTGIDPSQDQWAALSQLIKERQLIVLFDLAYQGFGFGLDKDAYAVRLFAQQGHEMFTAYSFSKNMGLYGERVGILFFQGASDEINEKVKSHLKVLIRGTYSNPPLHGSRIVATILKNPTLLAEWKVELATMLERVTEMRKAFIAALMVRSSHSDVRITSLHQQKGIFAFLALNPQQVQQLQDSKGIYMPSNGRLNLAGLNAQNIDYVADAIVSVTNA